MQAPANDQPSLPRFNTVLFDTPTKALNARLRTTVAPIAIQCAGFPLCPSCNEPNPETLRSCMHCGVSMTPISINGIKVA